jgi:lactate dehydrogenase-like 2-hydroxyacid dehydrogenase
MKTIIAGSRDGITYDDVVKAMEKCPWQPTEIVSGKARGVDTIGEQWAKENNIPVVEFPANWKKYGKRAGYLRNEQMAEYADALVAVWDGSSKGTAHMIRIAEEKKLKIHIHVVNNYTYDLQS